MKISPVLGTPSIPIVQNTGNSPEKLIRLKNIAAGHNAQNVVQSSQGLVQSSQAAETDEEDKEKSLQQNQNSVAEAETGKSDAGVQTNVEREVTQPLSPQFAALAKQRRALQVKEREIADREKALAGPSRSDLEAKIKSQPLSVLQELGVTYDQLTQEILAAQGGITPEIQALKAELKALKEGVDKTFTDRETAAEKAALADMRHTVNRLSAEGDDFELIRETRSHQDVMDLIYRTYKSTGELLDEVEAMRLVENELAGEALKIAKLKKVQGKLTPMVPLQTSQQQGMKTLTNKDSASMAMSRRQRAILAAQGNLKR